MHIHYQYVHRDTLVLWPNLQVLNFVEVLDRWMLHKLDLNPHTTDDTHHHIALTGDPIMAIMASQQTLSRCIIPDPAVWLLVA